MEKTIRCTVCTWRGPREVAESARRIRAAAVDPALEELQSAYAEHEAVTAAIGGAPPPRCPKCGHHTVLVRMHGYRAAI